MTEEPSGSEADRYLTPEARARLKIDNMLHAAGWAVQDADAVNLAAARGVAVREFILKSGHGRADYLLFVDRKPVGAVEAKPEGDTLTGVETQSGKYSTGIPEALSPPIPLLPFLYESTGVETRFTQTNDPEPRSREVFWFHRPETLADLAREHLQNPAAPTLRHRLRAMPPLKDAGLWPAQARAIRNLEASLREDRPRALVQMATGAGKTFTAANVAYRLIRHAGARRVLFLVDRAHLGRQTLKEFQQFSTPDDGRKFTELYNAQHLTSNAVDPVARVCISTIQRLYSILRGEPELAPELDEESAYEIEPAAPVEVGYNPAVPIETFDFIVVDECHRSIYGLWRQVLDYFDAFIVGLTATPSKQTFGFFNQNLVMEYPHEEAVADGVNVDFNVYRIKTEITERGSTIDAGIVTGFRNRETRRVRWERLDEVLDYEPEHLDRKVVAKDQIRTIVRAFKERLFTEIFPGRTHVPKTLIFAKDDSHADDIVQIVREEFGKGNDFAVKITYKTTGQKPEALISEFRTSYNPRIAVTVDMIATGTDVRPIECVVFMRAVKSRTFFEQMKGRGVRVIDADELRGVTPDAGAKTHFVIVDAVGVTETALSDTQPLERRPTVPFEKLLKQISWGVREAEVVSSVASRLARLSRQVTKEDRAEIEEVAGLPLHDLVEGLVRALDPDIQFERAQEATGKEDPSPEDVTAAANALLDAATEPLATNPALRDLIVDVRRSYEQAIDEVSKDRVVEAASVFGPDERAQRMVESFREFIERHKDEITALQVLYSRPYRRRLAFKDIRELAHAIARPPYNLVPERLWEAYQALERSKVRGSGGRMLTDIVSLVRFALEQEDELVPFKAVVDERFETWLRAQEEAGRAFTAEQRQWLERIRDHIAASMAIGREDFDYTPFAEHGGLGKAHEVFGEDLDRLLEEMTEALAA